MATYLNDHIFQVCVRAHTSTWAWTWMPVQVFLCLWKPELNYRYHFLYTKCLISWNMTSQHTEAPKLDYVHYAFSSGDLYNSAACVLRSQSQVTISGVFFICILGAGVGSPCLCAKLNHLPRQKLFIFKNRLVWESIFNLESRVQVSLSFLQLLEINPLLNVFPRVLSIVK